MEEKGNCRKSLKKVDAASRSPEVQWQRLLVVDKVLTDCLRSTLVFAVIKNLVIGFQNFDTFWNIYFLTLETWNSYRVTRAELPVVPEEPLRLTSYVLQGQFWLTYTTIDDNVDKRQKRLHSFHLSSEIALLPCRYKGRIAGGSRRTLTSYSLQRPPVNFGLRSTREHRCHR